MFSRQAAGEVGGGRRRRAGLALLAGALVAAGALLGCGSAGSTADAGSGAAAPTPKASASTPSTGTASTTGSAGGRAVRIVFVDVGQGDAAIITSGTWAGLIDGGPAGSASKIEAALRRLRVRRLNAVFVSHLHTDHTGGLPAVVADLRPRRAFMAGRPGGTLAKAFRKAGTSVVQARRGGRLRLGAVRVSVLSPASLSGDANADSLVLLVAAGGRRFLFTGDCTGPNEAAVGRICARGPPVTVLKVAHHGSRYSTTTGFLKGARPRTAVISVGFNTYGHPTQETIDRLRSSGARVYSTQKNGSITLTVSSGGALRWTFSRSPAPVRRGAR